MHNWMVFCKKRIDKVEEVWNRKLEQDREPSEEDSATDEAEDNYSELSEDRFSDILQKGKQRIESRSHIVQQRRDDEFTGLSIEKPVKDDTDLPREEENKEFMANSFWKLESEHSIDDLMAELD